MRKPLRHALTQAGGEMKENVMTLNWKSDDETWAEARAAREIGGKYVVRRFEAQRLYGRFHVAHYRVEYAPRSGSICKFVPLVAECHTMRFAKGLAETDHVLRLRHA
jgi:hypothetical protein